MRNYLVATAILLAACEERASLLDAPCPCLEGYQCCEALAKCLPVEMSAACPIDQPPQYTCALQENADGSAAIHCSDGSTFPVRGPQPQCPGLTFEGDFEASSDVDLEALRAYSEITGYLSIGSNIQARELELPCLERVGGELGIHYVPLKKISLPSLIEIGELEISGLDTLDQLELGALTDIRGEVDLGATGLVDLRGLSALTRIQGELSIQFQPRLETLAGLEALTSVGSLKIYNNPNLTSIAALSSLASLDGAVEIIDNSVLSELFTVRYTEIRGSLVLSGNALTGLQGLEDIAQVSGRLELNEASLAGLAPLARLRIVTEDLLIGPGRFTSLAELTNLTRVGGRLGIGERWSNQNCTGALATIGIAQRISVGGLSINCNPRLTNLDGLDVGPATRGSLELTANPLLTDLDSLQAISTISGDLVITGNSQLQNLDGFSGLTNAGSVAIEDNAALTDIDGLGNLWQIRGGVSIRGNSSLTTIEGLHALTSLDPNRSIEIVQNPALTTLAGLRNFGQAIYELSIVENASLVDLAGLEAIPSITAGVDLSGNAALTTISALNGLTRLGDLRISGNPVLVELGSFTALTELDDLEVENNALLSSLEGLETIQRLRSTLTIRDNPSLATLAGLRGARDVYAARIERNPQLTSLGLDSFGSAQYELVISENACLAQCLADELRDRVEASSSTSFDSRLIGNKLDCTCVDQNGSTLVECMTAC